MNNERYNGWANYETWNVALWYNNDEAIYDAIFDAIKHNDIVTADEAREIIQDVFLSYNMTATPDGVKITDAKINWGEIAEDLKEWIS